MESKITDERVGLAETKKCPNCLIIKDKDQFYKENRAIGLRLSTRCKECSRQKARERLVRIRENPVELQRHKDLKKLWSKTDKAKQESSNYRKKRAAERAQTPEAIKKAKNRQGRLLESGRMTEYKAWRNWLSIASDEWMINFYSETPWKNPRLTSAQKWKLRYDNDPEFNIKERLRNQLKKNDDHGRLGDLVRGAIKRNGNSSKFELLSGYPVSKLTESLGNQFTGGMNWDRFMAGDIHIDHIVPKSTFDMTKPEEVAECWSLSNLRPVWAAENKSKGAKNLFLC